jgi:uncharacterized protein YidB (DUF937 family)
MGLLDGLLGGGARRGGGMSPITMALLGLLAYRTLKGKNKNLSDIFGGGAGGGSGGGLGGLLSGGLGGLLAGGAAGNVLSGGLGDIIDQFKQHGQGDKADSWVERGPNKPIEPTEMEQALGGDRISWLMQQTGMSKQELLDGLSQELPQVVDRMTPEGRLPSEQEAERMIA